MREIGREGVENAKDTFYIALRNRLAVLNPGRTVMLRGVWRPGILVEANESVVPVLPAEVFVLRWTDCSVDELQPMPVAKQVCEVLYATEGTVANGGLDRGRALAEMDRELVSILKPYATQKCNYAQTPAAGMATQVFWSEPVLSTVTVTRDRLSRSAKVTVFSYEEASEQ
jgi:hypothetical protein